MKNILLVGLGGFLGTIARYKLSGLLLHHTLGWKFPLGTFFINVSGCLIAGVLAGLAEKHGLFNTEARLLLFTGLLGGYTTFSAFGLETVYLIQRQQPVIAMAYAASSLLAGVFSIWLGMKLIS